MLLVACADPADEADDAPPADQEETEAPEGTDPPTTGRGAAAPAVAPGFDGLTITVAVLAPAEEPDLSVLAGQRAYWRYVNDRLGGVGARYPVELEVAADAAAYPTVVADAVVVAAVADDLLVDGVLERLRRDGVVGSPGSRAVRWSRHPSLVPVGVPEPEQLEFAVDRLAAAGAPPPAACLVSAGSDAAAVVVGEAVAAGCADVVLRGHPEQVAAVVEAAAGLDAPVRWVLLADGWSARLAAPPLRRYAERRVVVVQEETCAPRCDSDRGATGEELADPWFRYGWVQARVMHQVLEEAVESGGLDRAAVAEAAATLSPVELDGVAPPWTYGGPDGRVAPTALAVYEVDADAPGHLVPFDG